MNKVSFNGINPNLGGKSVRDIQLPSSGIKERQEKRASRRMPQEVGSSNSPHKARGVSFMFWISALVILSALVIIATFMFMGRTTVDLTMRVAHLSLSNNIVHSAYKNPSDGELGYTVLEVTQKTSESVKATETKFVEQKASGKLTVYNDYGDKSQRIIKNTRFEAPDGKIYRVRNSFVVPGNSTIKITVYADKAGEEYNKSSAKFTIPGLKGDPRYEKFWAETLTPIKGGFSGKRPTVGESDLQSTKEKLRASLREKLLAELRQKLTKEQTIFDKAVFFNYESDESPDESGDSVSLTETATATAVVFDSSSLAEELAKESSTVLYEGDKSIVDQSALNFSIVQKEKVDPTKDELIQFTVSGDAKLLWNVDTDALKVELAGKPSSVLDSVLSNYLGVKDASVTIRPFWRNNFPTNVSDITITVETEQ